MPARTYVALLKSLKESKFVKIVGKAKDQSLHCLSANERPGARVESFRFTTENTVSIDCVGCISWLKIVFHLGSNSVQMPGFLSRFAGMMLFI